MNFSTLSAIQWSTQQFTPAYSCTCSFEHITNKKNTILTYYSFNFEIIINNFNIITHVQLFVRSFTNSLFTPRRFQSVGEFLDMHLFAASTFTIYFSRQQPNKWCTTLWNDFPLILLSEPTALSAGVQNTAALWEIWVNAEGQKLSQGREAMAAKWWDLLCKECSMLNYTEKVPMMWSYLLRAISLPVSYTLLSLLRSR